MSRALITGATGYIGTALIQYIESFSTPTANELVLLSSRRNDNYETIIYHPETFLIPPIPNINFVIHLGAFTPKSAADADNIVHCFSNILFTKELLDRLPKKFDRFVYASTIDVYKNGNEIIDEKSLTEPPTLYGWSKLFCEKMISAWCAQHNVSLVILRLGHVYGPGEDAYKKLIPETIKKIIKGNEPLVFSKGTEKRSFIHVADCARCIWDACFVDYDENIINLVSGKNKSILEIIQLLIKISGKNIFPHILGENEMKYDRIFDNQLMKRIFGEEKIELVDGLKEEYLYFLNKMKKN